MASSGQVGAQAHDPSTRRWRPIPPPPTDGLDTDATGVWTGRELVLMGRAGTGTPPPDVPPDQPYALLFDPSSDRWRAAPGPPEPVSIAGGQWIGSLILAYGRVGAAFDPASATWWTLPTVDDRPREFFTTVWTGEELIVWGGGMGESISAPPDGVAFRPTAP